MEAIDHIFGYETVDLVLYFFFFNDTATTEIYTLSLHDALPFCSWRSHVGHASHPRGREGRPVAAEQAAQAGGPSRPRDRKSTRLNSSHLVISYAVFCLKKKTFDTVAVSLIVSRMLFLSNSPGIL